MVTIAVIGGLGNQMFQYAFGRALVIINKTDLVLDTKEYETYTLHAYGLDNYRIQAQEVKVGLPNRLFRILQGFLPLKMRTYVQVASSLFYPQLLEPRKGNRYYLGYWQTPKYFEEFADIIRSELTPLHNPGEKNTEVMKQMENEDAISIHIRRGDYVTDPNANKRFGVCDLDYYKAAIQYIRERVESPKFYVFTNDIEWVRENFELEPMVIVDWNGVEKNYEDIRLMSHCKHHIIANSSFSWWGAWLNPSKDKIVIAPEKWLQKDNDDTRDLIPSNWIKL